jgi:hypothetical protein
MLFLRSTNQLTALKIFVLFEQMPKSWQLACCNHQCRLSLWEGKFAYRHSFLVVWTWRCVRQVIRRHAVCQLLNHIPRRVLTIAFLPSVNMREGRIVYLPSPSCRDINLIRSLPERDAHVRRHFRYQFVRQVAFAADCYCNADVGRTWSARWRHKFRNFTADCISVTGRCVIRLRKLLNCAGTGVT